MRLGDGANHFHGRDPGVRAVATGVSNGSHPSVERRLTTAASTLSAAPLDAKMERDVPQSASSSSSLFTPVLQSANCRFLSSPHLRQRISARHWPHSHVIASPDGARTLHAARTAPQSIGALHST